MGVIYHLEKRRNIHQDSMEIFKFLLIIAEMLVYILHIINKHTLFRFIEENILLTSVKSMKMNTNVHTYTKQLLQKQKRKIKSDRFQQLCSKAYTNVYRSYQWISEEKHEPYILIYFAMLFCDNIVQYCKENVDI